MPSVTQKATRVRRKSASTASTSRKPLRPLRSSESRRLRSGIESSCQIVIEIPFGIVWFALATYSFRASEISITSWSPTR